MIVSISQLHDLEDLLWTAQLYEEGHREKILLLESASHYVVLAGLELLGSSCPAASASKVAGIPCVRHHA